MKKGIGIVIVIIAVFVVFFLVSVTRNNSDFDVEASKEVIEDSYYVDGKNNLFSKMAFILDDCCYYIVDFVFGGIESIFLKICGN